MLEGPMVEQYRNFLQKIAAYNPNSECILCCDEHDDFTLTLKPNLVPRVLSKLPVPSRCERTLVLSGHVTHVRQPYDVGVGRFKCHVLFHTYDIFGR